MSLKCVIQNIVCVVTGSWKDPFAYVDTIAVADGKITKLGNVSKED